MKQTPRPIKDYCIGIYDGPHATPKESDEGPVFLGIKNITNDGQLDFSEIRHVSEQEYPKWTRRVVPEQGDVVFTYEATLHRYAVIPDGFRGCLGRRVALIRPNTHHTDSKYLLYYFLSQNWRSTVESNIISGATVDRIPLEKFPDFPVILPSLSEQKQIASILSTYDDLIENNRRRMALLEDAARQIYQEWFVRLRFPGYEHTRIVDGVPEGWDKCRISDLGDIVTGKTPSTKEEDNYGGDIMFVKTPDMHGNVYVLQTETCLTEKGANCQPSKFLPPESILVSCIGTVGVVSLTSERCQFNQQINALIPCKESLRYYCFFAFKDLKPRLDAIGGGVTMANVSKGKFESLDIMRPVSRLLRNFDDICRPVFKQIRTLSLQNQKLRTARDLLLPKLMSGEIAV
jgi:type I restriction enzyme S subunit